MNPLNSEVSNRGNAQDLNFLKEEKWLKKSIVNYFISKQKGRYWVFMIYTHPENPLQLLVRKIDHYRDMQTAERFAQIMSFVYYFLRRRGIWEVFYFTICDILHTF